MTVVLREEINTPRNEPPPFPSAVSYRSIYGQVNYGNTVMPRVRVLGELKKASGRKGGVLLSGLDGGGSVAPSPPPRSSKTLPKVSGLVLLSQFFGMCFHGVAPRPTPSPPCFRHRHRGQAPIFSNIFNPLKPLERFSEGV